MRLLIRILRCKVNLIIIILGFKKKCFILYKDVIWCVSFRYKVCLMIFKVFNGLIVYILILELLKGSVNK